MMTRAEALRWIAQTFEESPDHITEATTRDQIAAWDSLGVLTLMAGLDQEFGIVLPDGKIQTLQSVADVLGVLKEHSKLSD